MSGRRSNNAGREPSGNLRRQGLRRERQAAANVARRQGQQEADLVFLLRDQAFHVRNACGRRVEQVFGLPDVKPRGHPLLLAGARQSQGFLARGERALGDLQIEVQLTQLEVGAGDVRHQGYQDSPPSPLGGEQLSTGGLGLAAQPAPEIDLIEEAEAQEERVAFVLARGRDQKALVAKPPTKMLDSPMRPFTGALISV